jgi:hypothetical protein
MPSSRAVRSITPAANRRRRGATRAAKATIVGIGAALVLPAVIGGAATAAGLVTTTTTTTGSVTSNPTPTTTRPHPPTTRARPPHPPTTVIQLLTPATVVLLPPSQSLLGEQSVSATLTGPTTQTNASGRALPHTL